MVQTKVTIREVAERAGFSTTTVSHVLNNVPGKRIPDSTRTLVKAAADDLGYRPNRLAQGLRLQRSDTIGFVSDRIATSPHAGMTIVGAQRAAAEYGSLLLLMNSGTDADLEQREIRALLDRQVDGIVYAAEYHRLVSPPALLHETHAVLLDARPTGSDWAYAVPDEFGGAVTAVGALIESGHRRIGYVNNVDDIPATTGRLQGYRKVLSDNGIAVDQGLVVADQSDAVGGYRAADVHPLPRRSTDRAVLLQRPDGDGCLPGRRRPRSAHPRRPVDRGLRRPADHFRRSASRAHHGRPAPPGNGASGPYMP